MSDYNHALQCPGPGLLNAGHSKGDGRSGKLRFAQDSVQCGKYSGRYDVKCWCNGSRSALALYRSLHASLSALAHDCIFVYMRVCARQGVAAAYFTTKSMRIALLCILCTYVLPRC